MIRRITVLLTLLIFIIGSFTACGGNTESTADISTPVSVIDASVSGIDNNSGGQGLPLDEITDFILSKATFQAKRFGSRSPSNTRNGVYEFSKDGGWTGGFWSGMNFLCYEITEDTSYLDSARASMSILKDRLYQNPGSIDHDAGFLYSLTFVADYKLTGSEDAKKVALDAAQLLAGRYNEKGKFINAWDVWVKNDPFSEANRARMIIDTIYNLPLLFWASGVTGNDSFKKIAEAHAETCAEYIVRDDYSTFHTYVFDPDSGLPKYGQTYQGYSDESCWSRGQAWAIGGFAYAYRYTKNGQFIEVAEKCAQVFIDNLEADKVPMWDFKLPSKSSEPRDSSAASIAAAGLLELAGHVSEPQKGNYTRMAKEILQNLYDRYSTRDAAAAEGLLVHACGSRPGNRAVDCSLIYGDYFFTECIARLKGKTVIYW